VHDIGKLAVPEHILAQTRTALTPEERKIMEQHTDRGGEANLLPRLRSFRNVLPRSFATTMKSGNGSGYPDGLKGEPNSADRADTSNHGTL